MALTSQEENELIKLSREIELEEARTNYTAYVQYVHDGRWIPGRVHKYVCDTVQKFIETNTGNAYDILILSLPPQSGKSMMLTETLPSFYLGKNPFNKVIEISYNEDFAIKFGRKNKQKIEAYGKELFGIELSNNINRADSFELSNNVGSMIARGILSGITGNPGNLIIIDDVLKNRKEADSENIRESQKDEFRESVKTRLSAGGKIIAIGTRWHESDLLGYMIDTEENVTVINLPCECEDEDTDPIGRKLGDALCPELGKDNKWLAQFKKSYNTLEGNRSWNALFQGRPSAAEGNMLKRHWFKYWQPEGMNLGPVVVKMADGSLLNVFPETYPSHIDEIAQSWDCTFKKTEDSDFVAGTVVSRRLENFYLIDCVNERMGIVETMNAIEKISLKHPRATRKYIEDKANGSAVIEMLHHKLSGMIPVNPKGGKEARVSAVSPLIESGNFYLPHPLLYPWVNVFLEQAANFPNGKNDDVIDSLSQILNQMYFHSRDTYKEDLVKEGGVYCLGELKLMGITEIKARQMQKSGKIKLIGLGKSG